MSRDSPTNEATPLRSVEFEINSLKGPFANRGIVIERWACEKVDEETGILSSIHQPKQTTSTTTTTRRMSSVRNNNNNNHNNNNGNHIELEMDTNKRILCRIALDCFILLCAGFPILIFYIWGEPFERGFFCDDESLKHPFRESTVRNWMLYFIGLVLPIIVITITEFIQARVDETNGAIARRKYILFDYELPEWLVQCYKKLGVFAFGGAICQMTTDIAKYSIGRLRPHFFAVCQPIISDGSKCGDAINQGRYIRDFTCEGDGSTARMLKEVRLSFPSGHSSFTFYTMVFVAVYLQSRMTWRGSKLLRHFLQFLVVMIAWYTALSRVSDYKHHWSDVLAGSSIGALAAVLTTRYMSDLFVKPAHAIAYAANSAIGMTTRKATTTSTQALNPQN